MPLPPLIEAYLGGIRMVREAVTGLNQEQVLARPVAGKWSTLEVVCHLADFEPIYADRMKRTLAEDRPAFQSANEKLMASSLAYQARDLEEELSVIDSTRRQLARILRTVPETALTRRSIYRHEGKDEERTLERLLTLITNHVPHHVQFIIEKRRALGA